MYASKSTGGFYDLAIHGKKMPDDVVEISAEYHAELLAGQSAGQVIGWRDDGFPVLQDPPPPAPLTTQQVEALRLRAYANPLSGSDRYFAEAARMQAVGENGWEAIRAQGVTRFAQIQAEYPWP